MVLRTKLLSLKFQSWQGNRDRKYNQIIKLNLTRKLLCRGNECLFTITKKILPFTCTRFSHPVFLSSLSTNVWVGVILSSRQPVCAVCMRYAEIKYFVCVNCAGFKLYLKLLDAHDFVFFFVFLFFSHTTLKSTAFTHVFSFEWRKSGYWRSSYSTITSYKNCTRKIFCGLFAAGCIERREDAIIWC